MPRARGLAADGDDRADFDLLHVARRGQLLLLQDYLRARRRTDTVDQVDEEQVARERAALSDAADERTRAQVDEARHASAAARCSVTSSEPRMSGKSAGSVSTADIAARLDQLHAPVLMLMQPEQHR